jgi:putative Ig domain-containing protein
MGTKNHESADGRRDRPRTAWAKLVSAAMVFGVALACGRNETQKPGGAPMAQALPTRSGNRPPVVESVRLEPANPKPNDRVRAIAKGSDPDGDPVEFKYLWRIDGRPLSGTTSEVDIGGVAKGSRVEVTVIGNDGHLESQPVVAVATVGNQPPELMGVQLEAPGGIHAGTPLVANPQAQDPDGDPISYHYTWWVNGQEAGGDEPSLDTSKLRRGDTVKVRVVATDGMAESDAVESLPLSVGNAPPKITSSPGGLDRDGVFRYTVEAVDPDGDQNLRYRLVKGPEGMTMDSLTGVVQWKPTATQTGKQAVEVTVEDPQGASTSQRFELTVGVDQVQAAPAPGTPSPKAAPAPLASGAGSSGTMATGSPEPTRTGGAPVPKAQRTQPPAAASDDADEEAAAPASPQPSHPVYRHHGAPTAAPGAAPAEGESAE